jgi:hypothetical protein
MALNDQSSLLLPRAFLHIGARGGAVGWGTALQAVRLRVRFIDLIVPASLSPWGGLSL